MVQFPLRKIDYILKGIQLGYATANSFNEWNTIKATSMTLIIIIDNQSFVIHTLIPTPHTQNIEPKAKKNTSNWSWQTTSVD